VKGGNRRAGLTRRGSCMRIRLETDPPRWKLQTVATVEWVNSASEASVTYFELRWSMNHPPCLSAFRRKWIASGRGPSNHQICDCTGLGLRKAKKHEATHVTVAGLCGFEALQCPAQSISRAKPRRIAFALARCSYCLRSGVGGAAAPSPAQIRVSLRYWDRIAI